MALSKETFSLPFIGGIDKASDAFTTIKPARLENVLFERESSLKSNLKRRPGFSQAITGAYSGTTALPSFGTLQLHKLGSEAILESLDGIYGLNLEDSKAIIRSAKMNRMAPKITEIRHTDKNQREFDYAASNGNSAGKYNCYIWVEDIEAGGTTVGQIWVMVKDARTDQVLLLTRPEVASSVVSFSGPRVITMEGNSIFSVGDKFYCYYCRNNLGGGTADIQAFTVTFAAPTAISAVNTVDATYTAGTYFPPFDVVASNQYNAAGAGFGDRHVFVAYQSTAVLLKWAKVSGADGFTVSASITRNIGTAALHITAQCTGVQTGIPAPADSIYGIIWHANGNLIGSYTDDAFGATAQNTLSVTAASIGRATAIGTVGSATVNVYFDVTAAAGVQAMTTTLQKLTCTLVGGTSVAESQVVRSVGVGTRAWRDPNDGKTYMGVYAYSSSQPTFYVIELSGTYTDLEVVARSSPSQCGNIVSMWQRQGRVPGTTLTVNMGQRVEINTILISSIGDRMTAGQLLGAVDVTATGIAQLDLYRSIQYATCGAIGSAEIAGSLIFAGACPMQYDGQTLTELGFHYYPENPTLGTAAAAGIGAGTRSYCLVYEWLDATGKTHLSGVSNPVSITIAGGLNVVVTAPTLRLTRKSNVRIAVFRTTDGGTVFYRVARSTIGLEQLQNDPTANTVAFTDAVTDANLIGGEFLYTTGGVLDNDPYPACKSISTFQDRIVFSGVERKHLLQYTEQTSEFFFPAHSALYSFFVPAAGGRAVATETMDDNKLCVVQERSIGVIFGQGPNRLGLDNGYSEIQTVVEKIGCPWACNGSVIRDEFGVWFTSAHGLRHFNKGLSLSMMPDGSPLGLEIGESYAPKLAARAPQKTQIYFYTDQGRTLVWDFSVQQWSTLTVDVHSGVFVPQNTFANADPQTHVFITAGSATIWKFGGVTDNGSAFSAIIETSWIKMKDLQGFQRIYAVNLLGQYVGTGTFSVQVALNYSAILGTAYTMNPTVFDSGSGKFQVQHRLKDQKCEAVKFIFTDSSSAGGVSYSGIDLLVGLKPGMFKLESTKRVH